MMKLLLYAILFCLCWPIALVVAAVWMLVFLVHACLVGAAFLIQVLKRL